MFIGYKQLILYQNGFLTLISTTNQKGANGVEHTLNDQLYIEKKKDVSILTE